MNDDDLGSQRVEDEDARALPVISTSSFVAWQYLELREDPPPKISRRQMIQVHSTYMNMLIVDG